jgi:ABC-type multidrug transport system ATPase subunit
MDEAERCDRIVYINLGDIVARGTVAEVPSHNRSSSPSLLKARAPVRSHRSCRESPSCLRRVLRAALHISVTTGLRSTRPCALSRTAGLAISEAVPSLEDVFISSRRRHERAFLALPRARHPVQGADPAQAGPAHLRLLFACR